MRVVEFVARVAADTSQCADVRVASLNVFDTLALPDGGIADEGTKKLAAMSGAIMLFGAGTQICESGAGCLSRITRIVGSSDRTACAITAVGHNFVFALRLLLGATKCFASGSGSPIGSHLAASERQSQRRRYSSTRDKAIHLCMPLQVSPPATPEEACATALRRGAGRRWQHDEAVMEAHRLLAREAIASIPPYPDTFWGRGIAICGRPQALHARLGLRLHAPPPEMPTARPILAPEPARVGRPHAPVGGRPAGRDLRPRRGVAPHAAREDPRQIGTNAHASPMTAGDAGRCLKHCCRIARANAG